MPGDSDVRKQLVKFLRGGHAHATFDDTVDRFPPDSAGIRPAGLPHSGWELLEHLRITQNDILQFCTDPKHNSPPWPAGYWPRAAAPENAADWDHSVRQFRTDLTAMEQLVLDEKRDLHAAIPWGEGQTLLREALLVIDHNSYHLGQLLLVRRALGAWPAD